MDIKEYINLIRVILSEDMTIHQNQYDIWQLIVNMGREGHLADNEVLQYMLKVSKYTHRMAAYMAGKTGGSNYEDVYWRLLLFEAQCRQVDSCFLYLEKNRDKEKKFYEPRREHFMKFGIIDGFQALVDDKLDLLTISMPPGSGKSTAGIFFLASCIGWWPDQPNLASAHSGMLTKSIYDGVNQILSDSVEYTWREIFPFIRFNSRTGTNAKEQTIDVGVPKRFKSLTCRAINASLTGATRCEKILYADDLCSGIEEALSRERMDKLWQTYNTDLKTRKKNECKEIHIQTHWSTSDVVSRLKREHVNDPRARFITIPALDENGESNFEYKYGVGFTKQYFLDMKRSMDDVSFRCLYMNQPIEREGLLYHEDEIRRYITLPKDPPDAVLSIMDTKNTGKDFFVQPVFYKYGDDYYLTDAICSDESDYEIQYSRSVELIKANHVEACRIESNNGGSRVAFEINQRLEKEGVYCNITENYTTKNKETKIIVYAQWVKQHVLFRDVSLYSPQDDYGRLMTQVMSYTMAAKNAFDDAPDALAMFAEWQATPVVHLPTRIIKSVI